MHYRMRSYVERELRELVVATLPVDDARVGISGHSMGGHGALTIALRSPERYRSVSETPELLISFAWGAFASLYGMCIWLASGATLRQADTAP